MSSTPPAAATARPIVLVVMVVMIRSYERTRCRSHPGNPRSDPQGSVRYTVTLSRSGAKFVGLANMMVFLPALSMIWTLAFSGVLQSLTFDVTVTWVGAP